MTDDTMHLDCARARRTLHRLLDGDAVPDAERRSHEEHVAACSGCREAAEDLGQIARALADMPRAAMPPEILDEVWTGTVRARRRRFAPAGLWRLAASLFLTAALVGLWGWERRQAPAGPTDAELRRAAAEVRLVLGLSGRALHRAEETAIEAVLGREVSGALERLPVEWPGTDASKRRRSRT